MEQTKAACSFLMGHTHTHLLGFFFVNDFTSAESVRALRGRAGFLRTSEKKKRGVPFLCEYSSFARLRGSLIPKDPVGRARKQVLS